MKPKTKTDKAVVRLSAQLPPIGDRDKERAKQLIPRMGYNTGRHTVCLECGSKFKSLTGTIVTCPVCGQRIEIENTRKRHRRDIKYFSIFTTREDFQIERVLLAEREWHNGLKPVYTFNEVYQSWINKNGKTLFMTLPRSCNWYYFRWRFDEPFKLVKNSDIAFEGTSHGYRIQRILPVLTRNGFTGDFNDCNPVMLFKMLLRENWFETLWKMGLGHKAYQQPYNFRKWFKQIVYCHKRGYEIEDYSMWFDMLSTMERLGAPIHNGQHICPADLGQAHDMWRNRLRRLDEKRIREARLKRLVQDEKQYAETHGKFTGVVFSYEGINYHVLRNVKEFIAEGKAMHHCVYDNCYFNEEDSVIISASDDNGRLATIELNIKSWKIIQCRGKNNSVPPMCRKIENGVKANIKLFKQASKRKLSKSA